MAIGAGYVPAAGELDPKRLADAIRQMYQNGAGQSALSSLSSSVTALSSTVTALSSSVVGLSTGGVAGLLYYSSATLLKFDPMRGDRIKINGTIYAIPAAGITGLSNTSVYVNGVAAQNLAASTLYYVYAFNNSGTVTADFSTAAHATSGTAGNVGTEIKSGDDTRSLIGMIRTNGSSQFADSATQRFVRSWFCRDQEVLSYSNSFTAQRSTTSTSTSGSELNTEIRVEFLVWSRDTVVGEVYAYSFNAAPDYAFLGIGWDGTVTSTNHFSLGFGSNGSGSSFAESKSGLSEGYHYATLMGYVPSGTGQYGRSGGPYCTLNGHIR